MYLQLEVLTAGGWQVIGMGDFETEDDALEEAQVQFPSVEIRVMPFEPDKHLASDYSFCPICGGMMLWDGGSQCKSCHVRRGGEFN